MKLTKIKSIKKIKYNKERYDLEIDGNNNYFANNILVHNCRAIISIKDGVATTTSRTGKPLLGLEHITDELISLGKDIIFDGELYSNNLSFEEITSVVRKSKSKDPRMKDIFFYAFDLINGDTYHQRVLSLDNLVSGLTFTKIVPWYIVKSPEEVEKRHKQFVANGEEGTMVRNMNALYQPNKRSYDLLKLKDMLDEEFKIIGWKVGKGKFANIPTFEFITPDNKTFEAVPKGTEAERTVYLGAAQDLIGKMATVRFFEYTTDGIPRFPVMLHIREEE